MGAEFLPRQLALDENFGGLDRKLRLQKRSDELSDVKTVLDSAVETARELTNFLAMEINSNSYPNNY